MKVVVDENIPFIHGVLEQYAHVVYREGSKISRNDVREADALIVRTRTKCDEALLGGTAIRFIATATIGFDHIDAEFCRANGISWTNADGCNASSVNQYVAAALFHLAEKLQFNLADKTIGIVGVGNVGTKVARFCDAIGMHVLLNDPPRERREGSRGFTSLETIVGEADIITLHVPLTYEGVDKTFHLADADFLARLRPNLILFNTSRGEVVDTGALKSTLAERKLAACVLDVWEDEPSIDDDLLKLVDIGTPHIAGYSADGKANGTAMCIQAFGKYFGIGLDHWYPKSIPLPQTTQIDIDCANLGRQEIISRLIRSTYDISVDDRNLRESPRTFEKQRSSYPLRREFHVYSAALRNDQSGACETARSIGFLINES